MPLTRARGVAGMKAARAPGNSPIRPLKIIALHSEAFLLLFFLRNNEPNVGPSEMKENLE